MPGILVNLFQAGRRAVWIPARIPSEGDDSSWLGGGGTDADSSDESGIGTAMSEVTHLIDLVAAGDESAKARLFEFVYQELRGYAARRMKHERRDHTLTPTALVNEAYLKLFDESGPPNFRNRRFFYGAAANAMRQILIDYARAREARSRGGAGRPGTTELRTEDEPNNFSNSTSEIPIRWSRISLADEDALIDTGIDLQQIMDVDAALTRFAVEEPVMAQLVELRYFAGLTIPETAETLEISVATANRYWAYARAWLSCELKDHSGNASR